MFSQKINQQLSIIGVAFLIGGTSIGGGMLALPMATSYMGFLPSIVVMLVAWVFMTLTGLMILEVNLWMRRECHLVTMAKEMLGTPGKLTAWFSYVFVCYASLVAYTDGAGRLTILGFKYVWGIELSHQFAYALFITVFGSLLILSNKLIGRINAMLFTSLVLAYFCMVAYGSQEVETPLLLRQNWEGIGLVSALPLMLTSFSYQWIIPSLSPMLDNKAKPIRYAIVFGTTVSLGMYFFWQALVLGSVPFGGEHGLFQALQQDKLSTQMLSFHMDSEALATLANFFSFFALVTSFIGMSISFVDFLADGLDVHRKGAVGVLLTLGTFIPTYFFAVYYVNIFLVALDMTGGFGDALMNGLLPVAMIAVGLKRGYTLTCPILGQRWLLWLISIIALGTLVVETVKVFSGSYY